MRAKITRTGALEVVQAAQAVTSGSSRADVSTVQNILLTAEEDGKIWLEVTDYETSLRAAVPGEATEAGRVVVPVDLLANALREGSGDEAELVSEGARLRVLVGGENGAAKYLVNGVDPDDFPDMSVPDPSGGAEVPAEALRQMILRTRYSAATERSRYTLNSVRWEQRRGGAIRLVGCDGHRLAMTDHAASGKFGDPALVPLKAVAVIEKVLAAAPAEAVAVCRQHENLLALSVGDTTLGTLLLEGSYPEYEAVVREPGANPCVVDPSVLSRAFRQTAFLADKASRTVRVALRDGRMVLSAATSGAGGGEAEAEVGIPYAGPDADVLFNPDFILDILKAAGGEAVTLDVVDGNSSARLGAGDWLNVIMPVRT